MLPSSLFVNGSPAGQHLQLFFEQVRSGRSNREERQRNIGVHQDVCPNEYDSHEVRERMEAMNLFFAVCEQFTVGGWDGRQAHVRIM